MAYFLVGNGDLWVFLQSTPHTEENVNMPTAVSGSGGLLEDGLQAKDPGGNLWFERVAPDFCSLSSDSKVR